MSVPKSFAPIEEHRSATEYAALLNDYRDAAVALAAERAAECAGLREHLQWIAQQFCARTDVEDSVDHLCAESGDCITEWCLPCYAEAALAASPSPLAAAYKAAMDMSKHWVSSQGATIGDCQVWWDRYRELVSAFRAAQALAEGKGADRE